MNPHASVMDSSNSQMETKIHPVQSVPVEILEEIFLAACPSIDVRDPQGFIGRLGRVCSRWRSVALECPELWCNMDLSLGHQTMTARASMATNNLTPSLDSLINNCLRRSKQHPLSITFHPVAHRNHSYYAVSSIFARLLAHSKRWAYASFDAAVIAGYSGQLPLQKAFPALESLRLFNPSQFRLSRKPTNLRKLSIAKFDLVTASDLNVPWEQLTELSLEVSSSHIQYLPSIWRAVHGLKTLTLFVEELNTQSMGLALFNSIGPRTSLPSLVCLTVVSNYGGKLGFLIDTIRAPALSVLCLRHNHASNIANHPRLPIRSIDAFLESSSCTLKRLQLVDLNIEDAISLLGLANVAGIQDLHLQNIDPLSRVLDALRPRYAEGVASQASLPYLDTMTLSGGMTWYTLDDVVELIVEFVLSRLDLEGNQTGDPFKVAKIRKLFVWDIWIVRRLAQRLQEVLPPGMLRWDFSHHEFGRPGLISLTFKSY
jgi:F-box-like